MYKSKAVNFEIQFAEKEALQTSSSEHFYPRRSMFEFHSVMWYHIPAPYQCCMHAEDPWEKNVHKFITKWEGLAHSLRCPIKKLESMHLYQSSKTKFSCTITRLSGHPLLYFQAIDWYTWDEVCTSKFIAGSNKNKDVREWRIV